MRLAGVEEFWLYTSDDARLVSVNTPSNSSVLVKLEDNTDPIVSLDTNYDIANFKKITEELLLPILQKGEDNVLTEFLTVESVKNNFNLLGSSIVSTFSLKDLNNPVTADKFNTLIGAFNKLDLRSSKVPVIKNTLGNSLK